MAAHGWTTDPPLTVARGGLASAAVGQTIYAFGGNTGPDDVMLDSVEERHPGTGSGRRSRR